MSNGNMIVSDSGASGTAANLSVFTTAGAQVGSTYNAATNFGSGYTINDVAVSH
jgi:hypothetical protein